MWSPTLKDQHDKILDAQKAEKLTAMQAAVRTMGEKDALRLRSNLDAMGTLSRDQRSQYRESLTEKCRDRLKPIFSYLELKNYSDDALDSAK